MAVNILNPITPTKNIVRNALRQAEGDEGEYEVSNPLEEEEVTEQLGNFSSFNSQLSPRDEYEENLEINLQEYNTSLATPFNTSLSEVMSPVYTEVLSSFSRFLPEGYDTSEERVHSLLKNNQRGSLDSDIYRAISSQDRETLRELQDEFIRNPNEYTKNLLDAYLMGSNRETPLTQDEVNLLVSHEIGKALLKPIFRHEELIDKQVAFGKVSLLEQAREDAQSILSDRSYWRTAKEVGSYLAPLVETIQLGMVAEKSLDDTGFFQGGNYAALYEEFWGKETLQEAQEYLKDIRDACEVVSMTSDNIQDAGFLYMNIVDNLFTYTSGNKMIDNLFTILDLPYIWKAQAAGKAVKNSTKEGVKALATKTRASLFKNKGDIERSKEALVSSSKVEVDIITPAVASDVESALPSLLKEDVNGAISQGTKKGAVTEEGVDTRARSLLEDKVNSFIFEEAPENLRKPLNDLQEVLEHSKQYGGLNTIDPALVERTLGEYAEDSLRHLRKRGGAVKEYLKTKPLDINVTHAQAQDNLLQGTLKVTLGTGADGSKGFKVSEEVLHKFLKDSGFNQKEYSLVKDATTNETYVQLKKDVSFVGETGTPELKRGFAKTLLDYPMSFLGGSVWHLDKQGLKVSSMYETMSSAILDRFDRVGKAISKYTIQNQKEAMKLMDETLYRGEWIPSQVALKEGYTKQGVEVYNTLREVSDNVYHLRNTHARSVAVQTGFKTSLIKTTPRMRKFLEEIDPEGKLNFKDFISSSPKSTVGQETLRNTGGFYAIDFSTNSVKRVSEVTIPQNFVATELQSSVLLDVFDEGIISKAKDIGGKAKTPITYLIVPKALLTQSALPEQVLKYEAGQVFNNFKHFGKVANRIVTIDGTPAQLVDTTLFGAKTFEEAVGKTNAFNKILDLLFDTSDTTKAKLAGKELDTAIQEVALLEKNANLNFSSAEEVLSFLKEKGVYEAVQKGRRITRVEDAGMLTKESILADGLSGSTEMGIGKHVEGITGSLDRSFRAETPLTDLSTGIVRKTIDEFDEKDLGNWLTKTFHSASYHNTINLYREYQVDKIKNALQSIATRAGGADVKIPASGWDVLENFDKILPASVLKDPQYWKEYSALQHQVNTLKRQLKFDPNNTYRNGFLRDLREMSRDPDSLISKWAPKWFSKITNNLEDNTGSPADWLKSYASVMQFGGDLSQILTQGMASAYAFSVHPLLAKNSMKMFNIVEMQRTLNGNLSNLHKVNKELLKHKIDGLATMEDLKILQEHMDKGGIRTIGNSHLFQQEYSLTRMGSRLKKVSDASNIPMDLGNTIGKTVGFYTAVQEQALKLQKNYSQFTKNDWLDVYNKGIMYSGNMTKMKRAWIQDGLAGLLTVWQGQSMRNFEMLFSPASPLTSKERLVMGISQLGLGGIRGLLGDYGAISLGRGLDNFAVALTGNPLSPEDKYALEQGVLSRLILGQLGVHVNMGKYGTQFLSNNAVEAVMALATLNPEFLAEVLDGGQYMRLLGSVGYIFKGVGSLLFDNPEFKSDRFLSNLEGALRGFKAVDDATKVNQALSLAAVYNRNYKQLLSEKKDGEAKTILFSLLNAAGIKLDAHDSYYNFLKDVSENGSKNFDTATRDLRYYIGRQLALNASEFDPYKMAKDFEDFAMTNLQGVMPDERNKIVQKVLTDVLTKQNRGKEMNAKEIKELVEDPYGKSGEMLIEDPTKYQENEELFKLYQGVDDEKRKFLRDEKKGRQQQRQQSRNKKGKGDK